MKPYDIWGIDLCQYCRVSDARIFCRVQKASIRTFDLPCSQEDEKKCATAKDKELVKKA